MFCAMRAMLAGVAERLRAPKRALLAEQQRVLLALARRAATAATVRQLVLLEALGARLLPVRLLPALRQAVQVRLVELPLVPALPGVRKSPSRRSSSSRTRPGKSTTQRRRAR